jgi:hypothetical protein
MCLHVAIDGDGTPDLDFVLALERAGNLELAKYLDLVAVGSLSVLHLGRCPKRVWNLRAKSTAVDLKASE